MKKVLPIFKKNLTMYLFNDLYFHSTLCFKNVRIPHDNANSMLPFIEHLIYAKHVT